jgi:hypothetical protein
MPPPNPDHRLDQADQLLSSSAGAPRKTDLRRAISNAYYAVFHTILQKAADTYAGASNRQSELYALVYRSIDHRSISDICSEVIKQNLKPKYAKYVPPGGFGPNIHSFATAFPDLQQKRHLADYDPLYDVRTSDVVAVVALARAAISNMESANTLKRKSFIALILFPVRGG